MPKLSRSSRPSKPVETMLNRFTQYALPFHLDIINQHRMNIEEVRMALSNNDDCDCASRPRLKYVCFHRLGVPKTYVQGELGLTRDRKVYYSTSKAVFLATIPLYGA